MHIIEIYFLLFITYAIFGWCMEVVGKIIEFKRFINRGFLIGPYCPIYGCGAILMTLLLKNFTDNPIILFLLALVICSILEYMTSYILEKIFHARWWDYSKQKFNLNGRICVNTMIPFGLLGLAMMYFINPFLFRIYNSIEPKTLTIMTVIIFIIFITDMFISIVILSSVRKENKVLDKDNTEEMAKKVHDILVSKGLLYKRFSNAYPNVKHITKIVKDNIENLKRK